MLGAMDVAFVSFESSENLLRYFVEKLGLMGDGSAESIEPSEAG